MKAKITALNKEYLVEFKNDDQFISFMTTHNDKINNIEIINESELPATSKSVEMVKISKPTGWTSLEKSAFVTKEKNVEKKGMTLGGKYGEFKYEPNKNLESSTTDKVSDSETESPALKGEEPKTSNVNKETSTQNFEKESEDKKESKEEKKEEDVDEDTLEEGFKDGLKKAGKYAKGALAGAAMAGALVGGGADAKAMDFDPYQDGATRPFEDVDTGYQEQSWEEVLKAGKPITINGYKYTIEDLKKTQKEHGFSDEDMTDLINGIDPYYDGATRPFEETMEKPTMDDVDFEDDLTDADREMYTSEVQHILDIWDELSSEEQKQLKDLMFNKKEKETLNEKGCLEEFNHPMINNGSVQQDTSNDNEFQVNIGDVFLDNNGNEITVKEIGEEQVNDNVGGKGRLVKLTNTGGENIQMPSSVLANNYKRKEDKITESEGEDFEQYEICAWCEDKLPKSSMKKEEDLGWLCNHCEKAISSRGEELHFEND